MIIDSIKNSELYEGVHPLFKQAFEWLKTTDLKTFETGKHSIDGDNLIANVMELEGKEVADAVIESHVKYIDIQYIITGEELMGYTPLNGQTPIEISEERDCIFYKEPVSFTKVKERMFAIFFPQDIHQPNVKSIEGLNKKVVIKVKVNI